MSQSVKIDVSESAERRAKSFGNVYIGCVVGTKQERETLARTLNALYEKIGTNLGRDETFTELTLRIEIRGGKLALCKVADDQSFKPTRDA